jgi:predicted nucleotidyltransferase
MEQATAQPDQASIDALVERIVDSVHPLRIIMFGSAARGDMGPDSDVDLLVVMPEGTHCLDTAGFLHTRLHGIPLSVDILVATPSDLERHKDNIGLIYYVILEEGRDLYHATPDGGRGAWCSR